MSINIAYFTSREEAEALPPEPLPEGVAFASAELEPDKGWIAVLHCPTKIKPKYADGMEWRILPPPEAPPSKRKSRDGDDDERKRERRERRRLRRAARKRAQGG